MKVTYKSTYSRWYKSKTMGAWPDPIVVGLHDGQVEGLGRRDSQASAQVLETQSDGHDRLPYNHLTLMAAPKIWEDSGLGAMEYHIRNAGTTPNIFGTGGLGSLV